MRPQPVIWLIAAILLGLPQWSAAQDPGAYCAFQIHVGSPTGSPVRDAPVSAADQNGFTVGTATSDENGDAAICDVPIGLIDIHVGDNRCGAVTVHYLKPDWLRPRRVWVTYQNCGGAEHTPPNGCSLTIRVRDSLGNPLTGVQFEGSDGLGPMEQTGKSDQYGRIFRAIRFGESLAGALAKPGYATSEIVEPCEPPYQKERIVILNKR
jgi:hypothetical protein